MWCILNNILHLLITELLACITGALGTKRGKRGISHLARDKREWRGEGRRKNKALFFSSLRLALREEMLRSPRLPHKAPVMQAIEL